MFSESQTTRPLLPEDVVTVKWLPVVNPKNRFHTEQALGFGVVLYSSTGQSHSYNFGSRQPESLDEAVERAYGKTGPQTVEQAEQKSHTAIAYRDSAAHLILPEPDLLYRLAEVDLVINRFGRLPPVLGVRPGEVFTPINQPRMQMLGSLTFADEYTVD